MHKSPNLRKNDFILIKRAMKYTKPYILKLVITFFCILSNIGFGLIQPIIWGLLIKDVIEMNFHGLTNYLIILASLNIVQLITNYLQSYLFTNLSENIVFDLKHDMYNKILNLPAKAFDEMRIGDFISRLHGDAVVIASVATNQLLHAIVDILKIISIGIAVFSINTTLALIILGSAPITYFIYRKYGKVLRDENNLMAKLNDNYFSNISESISAIREIKSMGIKKIKFDQFILSADRLKKKSIKITILNTLSNTFSQCINVVSQILILGLGGYLVISGILQLQYYVAFSSYSGQFTIALLNITRLNSNIQQVMTSLERVFTLMDGFSYGQEQFGDKKIEKVAGSVTFKNISFEYNSNSPLLKNISFTVQANSIFAIVGLNGSGKTTIFNLLQKLYTPQSGSIEIDDIDLTEFDEASLKSHVSVVRQDPFLFNASIKDNLLLAYPSATDSDILKACEASYIHDFVMTLPEKYNTIIGENGVTLSGGQVQRLAIARAILKNAKIILFDEATSSIDNESQYYIKKVLYNLSKEHTVLIIAHKLNTIIDADKIIVIEDGYITANGKHEELIKQNNMYRRLYEKEIQIMCQQNKQLEEATVN